jgi:hypothetical protein
MEFREFPKIERIGKVFMTVTQKLHGTNASIWIYEYTSTNGVTHEPRMGIKAGRRTDFITVEKDNYGFARFVHDNAQALIEALGPGVHFGEWCGPGINSGEGLTEKTLFLFDVHRHPPEKPLPPRVRTVPLLYKGPLNMAEIEKAKEDLRQNGSKAVPGFMRPEGVVVHIPATGHRFKDVFEAEETAWTKPAKPKTDKPSSLPDVSHLLQPIRLEKLLSRDEEYVRGFPNTLPQIAKDYVADLEAEGQIVGDDDAKKLQRKALGGILYTFIKNFVKLKESAA